MARYECSEHGYIGKNEGSIFFHLHCSHEINTGVENKQPRYYCRGKYVNVFRQEHEKQNFRSLRSLLIHLENEHDIYIIAERGILQKRFIHI